jgi:integrase
VPTLEAFAARFLAGHARANQHKPSGIAANETIISVPLVPLLGTRKLGAITSEDVQTVKMRLRQKKPKTANNVLTVLNTMLRKAIEWAVLDQMPCHVRLLPAPKPVAHFHEFAANDALIAAAKQTDWCAELIVLLGGDAGLRCGEIMALEWSDVDLRERGCAWPVQSGRVR